MDRRWQEEGRRKVFKLVIYFEWIAGRVREGEREKWNLMTSVAGLLDKHIAQREKEQNVGPTTKPIPSTGCMHARARSHINPRNRASGKR